jgi:hypothetical protein
LNTETRLERASCFQFATPTGGSEFNMIGRVSRLDDQGRSTATEASKCKMDD